MSISAETRSVASDREGRGPCPPSGGGPIAPDARAARLAKFEREQTIVDCLNSGFSACEIGARIGVGEKRMHAIIREILARRMPEAPEDFAALQASRLNAALGVAFAAMTGGSLKAVDRVIRIVRDLDRYHGFVAARGLLARAPATDGVGDAVEGGRPGRAADEDGRRAPPAGEGVQTPPVRPTEPAHRPESPAQPVQKIESALGSSTPSVPAAGLAAAAAGLAAAAAPASRLRASRAPHPGGEAPPVWRPEPAQRPEFPLQPFEKAGFATGLQRLAQGLAASPAFPFAAPSGLKPAASPVRARAAGATSLSQIG